MRYGFNFKETLICRFWFTKEENMVQQSSGRVHHIPPLLECTTTRAIPASCDSIQAMENEWNMAYVNLPVGYTPCSFPFLTELKTNMRSWKPHAKMESHIGKVPGSLLTISMRCHLSNKNSHVELSKIELCCVLGHDPFWDFIQNLP